MNAKSKKTLLGPSRRVDMNRREAVYLEVSRDRFWSRAAPIGWCGESRAARWNCGRAGRAVRKSVGRRRLRRDRLRPWRRRPVDKWPQRRRGGRDEALSDRRTQRRPIECRTRWFPVSIHPTPFTESSSQMPARWARGNVAILSESRGAGHVADWPSTTVKSSEISDFPSAATKPLHCSAMKARQSLPKMRPPNSFRSGPNGHMTKRLLIPEWFQSF